MWRPTLLLLLFGFLVAHHALDGAEPFRERLISEERDLHLDEWKVSNYDILSKSKPAFSVKTATLRGGKQEGVDLITVDNGALRFTVIPTRGMGVLRVEAGDVLLGWDSPAK